MNLTDRKFWNSEQQRLRERREALATEADGLHGRLTEITKELALLDDVTRRLGEHLPAVDQTTRLEVA